MPTALSSPVKSATPPKGRRVGFTLVEFMIVIVILGAVTATLVGMLNKQQRFYHGARELLATRSHLREAGQVLLTDLRPITPASNDVYTWSDNGIAFRAFTGSSIACRIVTASNQIILPPTSLRRNNTLSSWITTPESGDSVLIYDEGPNIEASDDFWRPYQINAVAGVTAAAGCNTGTSNYLEVLDAASTSYLVTLSAAIPTSILRGAPVRIFRRAEYSLYQNTSDGKWYLGYRDCLPTRATPCNALGPVSGPYRPYAPSTPGVSGLTFTYYDSLGATLAPATGNRLNIARMEITARTLTDGMVSMAGGNGIQIADSLNFTVGMRNRR